MVTAWRSVVRHITEAWTVLDDLPPFMTVEQAAEVLQLGRSKTYELTVEWERSGGTSGLPFLWFGSQKRIPRVGLARLVESALPKPPAA
jgi:excisionase family DNA binding protein